ncbi:MULTISPECIES: cytochrome P450 [Rhodococcus]|uniref:Cytochrome P450 n=1 Tax=Rhodococcus chondri TaxID=3065941 RepID=A0ABU7JLD2_9NOCA|nr:cytochrome P450 [Rhodococcus sp. CC-R104]MEE2030845.1 cytochrome P450 [Rhodococcus sp. CC-R104]
MVGTESVASLLMDLDWWQYRSAERDDFFASLRRENPRAFVPVGTRGFWALTRHADVLEVSRRPEDFCSGEGTQIFDQPAKLREYRGSFIDMDNPEHARLRKIVSRGFTNKALSSIREDIEATVSEILDGMPSDGCDFVSEFAALVPLRIIDNLLGIPRSHEAFILEATNVLLGAVDPEYVPDQSSEGLASAMTAASKRLIAILNDLAEERIAEPQDDLITRLVAANDAENLTPQEMAKFFILLVGAGNETTRNAISHGLHLLTKYPEQRDKWLSDYDRYAPTAIEEILRIASPVVHMRRTVTHDGVRLGDQEFNKGDKVVLWYGSANRDESVFENPYDFDITRDPNPHLAFGAPGPHFCLGAHLARLEMHVAFRMLFERFPDIHTIGEPDVLRANFLNGIKHLRVEYTAP